MKVANLGPWCNVRFPPIADIQWCCDNSEMVSFHRPEIRQTWDPPLTLEGVLHRGGMFWKVRDYLSLAIRWRWATAGDWPERFFIGSDFRFARKNALGFAADIGTERLFLVPRVWEEPEWAFAVLDTTTGSWRGLGNLEPAPECWDFPDISEDKPA